VGGTWKIRLFSVYVSDLVNSGYPVAVERNLASETDPQLERLRQYISRWDGPTGLKDRVLGLTSMAATPSTTSLLTKLKSQGLVTESQIKVWKELRPKIAHGNVIDYADEKLWQNQNLLISMFHRLVLRLIGYKGPITDFSTDDLRTIEFNWYTD